MLLHNSIIIYNDFHNVVIFFASDIDYIFGLPQNYPVLSHVRSVTAGFCLYVEPCFVRITVLEVETFLPAAILIVQVRILVGPDFNSLIVKHVFWQVFV